MVEKAATLHLEVDRKIVHAEQKLGTISLHRGGLPRSRPSALLRSCPEPPRWEGGGVLCRGRLEEWARARRLGFPPFVVVSGFEKTCEEGFGKR